MTDPGEDMLYKRYKLAKHESAVTKEDLLNKADSMVNEYRTSGRLVLPNGRSITDKDEVMNEMIKVFNK
jgi:hypothetical protein